MGEATTVLKESSMELSTMYAERLFHSRMVLGVLVEVEEAIRTLKAGKSPGVNNIPGELVKHGGPAMQRKLTWFGHICRLNTLAKTILQGTVAGGRKRGRPRKTWLDNVKKWTDLSTAQLIREAEDRTGWAWITARLKLLENRPGSSTEEKNDRIVTKENSDKSTFISRTQS
ncbi:hypothetical protein Bbelb_143870 [Branchiostoma belcheri]|nr:hypothetical protein Bbelb_143870 [Branchiostoma belcheri]